MGESQLQKPLLFLASSKKKTLFGKKEKTLKFSIANVLLSLPKPYGVRWKIKNEDNEDN